MKKKIHEESKFEAIKSVIGDKNDIIVINSMIFVFFLNIFECW